MREERAAAVRAALEGAVIGAELGLRHEGTVGVAPEAIEDILGRPLTWYELAPPPPHTGNSRSLAPFLETVVKAYAKVGGRITAEDWARELLSERSLREPPAFWLLDFYTVLELLEEGMNPRLTGLGNTPMGSVSVPCLVVGAYHAGDPDAAYVDAVELASVWQRRPATDWAALAAAALASALKPGANVNTIADDVLSVGATRAPEVKAEIVRLLTEMDGKPLYELLNAIGSGQIGEWYAYNPPAVALMLLHALASTPTRLLAAAARVRNGSVYAPVVFAVVGALWGDDIFAAEWRSKACPLVEALLPLLPAIDCKLARERLIVGETERLLEPGEMGEPLLLDKVHGCILAGAIGNAMGSPCEGMLYHQVDERYPGGVTGILDPSRLKAEDDNQMALLLTDTYLRLEGRLVTARDFGATWMKQMERNGFWLCCRNTYDLIRSGMDPRVTGHWNLVTGSSVMCMEPVGLYHLADPHSAYVDATAISYMEQRGLDVTAAAILAASVAEALRAEASVESVCQAALDAAPEEPLRTFDDRGMDSPRTFIARCLEIAERYNDVFAARAELYEKCLYFHCIDPLELLGLAYAIFRIANGDVRQAAIGGTNIGRDADTIAGRAAMLSGTLRGAHTIPAEWVALVPTDTRSLLLSVSEGFVRLHRERKLPALRQRLAWYAAGDAL